MKPVTQESNTRVQTTHDSGLMKAISGQYRFSIKAIFDEAWAKSKGFKSVYWGALAVLILVGLGLMALVALIMGLVAAFTGHLTSEGLQFATAAGGQSVDFPLTFYVALMVVAYAASILFLPLLAGLWMIAIRHISNRPIRISLIFGSFFKPLRYWLANLWINLFFQGVPKFLMAVVAVWLATLVGDTVAYRICFPLALVVGLYVYVSYAFSMPLLADKQLGTWQALEGGRKAVGCHWLQVCRALMVIWLVTVMFPVIVVGMLAAVHLSFLLFGVILIWLIPFCALCLAILYREIFGISSTD